MILLDYEKVLMKNANMDVKNLTPMLEARLKGINKLIDFYNFQEDEILVDMGLPTRDNCIYSLSMIKEK